jgi:4-amino-4-deoxy-L-arabinose transferase-like glycosyltransferase
MLRQLKRILTYPAFIVLFAYLARMAILTYSWSVARVPVKSFLPYGYELGRVAASIAAGQGFASPLRFVDTGPTAWFTPIYPYLVAGIFKIWGIFSFESRLIIEASNCAFAALTIFPIYGIARRTFGNGVAVGAAWGWTFLPTSLFFPITWIWDTTLAAFCMAMIFWATLAMREAKSNLAWAGYGALWAAGVLVNPSILSLFPFLVVWAAWRSRGDLFSWVRRPAPALLVFVLCLVPWTVRNYRVFGKFMVLRSNFGLELWLGNNPAVPDTWSPWLHPNDSEEEADTFHRMGEMAYMEEKESEAIAFMRTHPADTINFTFRRFIHTWLALTDSPADEWAASPLYLKAFIVLNVLVAVFTLLGALFARRTRPLEATPYLIVLLVFPLIFYLTHSSLRYRFPMDPIMMVLASFGVAYPMLAWNGRAARQQEAVAPAPPVPTL